MAAKPSSDTTNTNEAPAPQVLTPRSAEEPAAAESAETSARKSDEVTTTKRAIRRTYRPTHKATFVGLAVVVAILAVNAGIIAFVIESGQSKSAGSKLNQDTVTLSQAALDKVGINRSALGDSGVQLTVNPNAKFNGTVTVNGNTTIAGTLDLNNKLSANQASLTQLQAGDTSLNKLDVNGDATVNTLNTRQDLQVAGTTRLQGPLVLTQLLTVNNSANVTGNLAVGGSLTVSNFHTSSLTSDTTLTIGGHVITRGNAPSLSQGNAMGPYGTASISGNDAAGTISLSVGTGATGGTVATVTFRQPYGGTPHVVVTPVGASMGSFYINRNSTGFSIMITGSLAPGGYAFDYIVEQ